MRPASIAKRKRKGRIVDWLNFISQFYAPISTLVNLIIVWVIWSLRQSFARKEDLTKLEAAVSTLKSEVGHLPTGRETNELSIRIATLHGDIKTLEANVKGLGRSLDRVEKPLNMMIENELKGNNR
ncbi:MAG: hypothetical protein DCC73_11870 [Proteobacteria bacterium]|nr:MAG: hypothetical protein DCC73_11870 [Pseudomonadota bacterium]